MTVIANVELITVASVAAGASATMAVAVVKAIDLLSKRKNGNGSPCESVEICRVRHEQVMAELNRGERVRDAAVDLLADLSRNDEKMVDILDELREINKRSEQRLILICQAMKLGSA